MDLAGGRGNDKGVLRMFNAGIRRGGPEAFLSATGGPKAAVADATDPVGVATGVMLGDGMAVAAGILSCLGEAGGVRKDLFVGVGNEKVGRT